MMHLYVAFWRPDVLASIQATDGKCAALCDYIGPAQSFTCSLASVECEACRHNFLEGLPNGNGSKISYDEYVRFDAAAGANRRTLKERAAELDKADAGWSTAPAPKADGWTTAADAGKLGGWSTS